MSGSERAYDGSTAAVLFSAAALVPVARSLDLGLEYRENPWGIVSVTTLARYPVEQEVLWAVLAGVLAGLFAWALSRLLQTRSASAGRIAWAEAAGGLALASVLLAPPWLGAGLALVGLCAAGWALRRPAGHARPAPPRLEAPRALSAPALGLAVAGALLLSLLLVSGFWVKAWSVIAGIPDERLTSGHFKFLTETGQHLAWVDAVYRGGLQGRDFFCLYGPLNEWTGVAAWRLLGRSIAAWELSWALTRVLGWLSLLLLAGSLLRHRWLALLLPFLLPWVKLRIGLAFFGLLCLVIGLRRGAVAWLVAAGALGGLSLLYSQEFGMAFCLGAAGALALGGRARPALGFLAGLGATALPVLGYHAAHGALIPMLRDLYEYPRYLMAGYGNLAFPSLVASLPLSPLALVEDSQLALRMGYGVAAILVGGALILLPVSGFEWRRPLASLARLRERLVGDPERLALLLVAVVGIVAFRSALGRSQLSRTLVVAPTAALLCLCALDRALSLLRRSRAERPLALFRLAALALGIAAVGFAETARPLHSIGTSLHAIPTLLRRGHHPRGDADVNRTARFIRSRTPPGEPVLFLPNDAALYYLSERPSPIRFVVGHQMVTEAHRREALAALQRSPPAYVVWDHRVLRVDGISDERVFGRAFLDWIDRSYAEERRFGPLTVLRRRSDVAS